uniref:Uncharacterized protein n=1 Tax=Setaria viridis TaxID=4556 RepID=A0A4V6D5K8_SETVI|nr:hypothetical protein SEVIR_6G197400v2 [Setaria viridis]
MPAGQPIQQSQEMEGPRRVFMEKKKRTAQREGWRVTVQWYGWKKLGKEAVWMKRGSSCS